MIFTISQTEQEQGENMDCKDEEKMIPVFLQDELDIKVLNQFIEHIDGCWKPEIILICRKR